MIGPPPSLAGAVQETLACALPAVAVTPVGAPGAVASGAAGAAGVTLLEATEFPPVPVPLLAETMNV